MMIYLYMTAISCMMAYLAGRHRTRAAAIFWMLASSVPFILVSALRWNIGTDYSYSYAPEYEALAWHLGGARPGAVGLLSSVANAQIHYKNAFHATGLFRLVESALLSVNADVQWLFALFALWTIGLVFLAIYRQSPLPVLSIFLFVFTSNFFLSLNIMRQYFSISLCLLAFEPAQKRRLPLFAALVALAAMFHPTALVFLPVYFLANVKLRPLHALLAIAAAVVLSPLVRMALEAIIPAVLPKYKWYLGSRFDAREFEWLFLLLNLTVFALSAYYYKAGRDKPYFTLWYNANLLGTIFLCFSAAIPLMKRINYYYAACHFLFIPLLVTLEGNKNRRRLLTAAICLAFIAETVVAVMLMNKNGVYPYTGIWEMTEVPYYNWAR